MHELSIAVNLVSMVEENAKKVNSSCISEIEIEIGSLSGVVLEALEFAMEEAVVGTILQPAKITFTKIEAFAKCEDCGQEFFQEELYTPCPKCASFRSNLIKGNELILKKIVF